MGNLPCCNHTPEKNGKGKNVSSWIWSSKKPKHNLLKFGYLFISIISTIDVVKEENKYYLGYFLDKKIEIEIHTKDQEIKLSRVREEYQSYREECSG